MCFDHTCNIERILKIWPISPSKWLSSLELTLVEDHRVTTAHLEIKFYYGKEDSKLTISIAMVCVQPLDPLQPVVLTWRRVDVTKDTSTQPRFGGTEVEERRKGMTDSLFLSKYPREKWKHGEQLIIVTFSSKLWFPQPKSAHCINSTEVSQILLCARSLAQCLENWDKRQNFVCEKFTMNYGRKKKNNAHIGNAFL